MIQDADHVTARSVQQATRGAGPRRGDPQHPLPGHPDPDHHDHDQRRRHDHHHDLDRRSALARRTRTDSSPAGQTLDWGHGYPPRRPEPRTGGLGADSTSVPAHGDVNSSLSGAIYLGSATIAGGLQAGYDQNIVQTLKLPSRLPYG